MATRRLLLLNVVGLTAEHLAGPHVPRLSALAREGFARPMSPVTPAVTCTAQATLLTGLLPRDHGIVGNGWYFRDLAEVLFWRQSNRLMHGERLYQAGRARDPDYRTAKLFWWYNMYAPVEWAVTPRPSYPADGRKLPDIYTEPAALRDALQARLGPFPLFQFWGPGANIASTRWIADAAVEMMRREQPSLSLVYLPHLDYDMQRWGPADPRIAADLRAVDAEAGKLIDAARAIDAEVLVVSEYAITAVDRPIHLNRHLREWGYLRVRRETLGWETLDAGASPAFAVADHQLAHVYVARPEDIAPLAERLRRLDGVEQVLDRAAQAALGLDHERSGELVVIAAPGSWFTYYYWLDDARAPDYARTVDIHRKPGYDPVELFVDPALCCPWLRIGRRLLQKRLGMRYLMDVVSLDASIVRGSHGRPCPPGSEAREGAVFISSSRRIEQDEVRMTDVKDLALRVQFEG